MATTSIFKLREMIKFDFKIFEEAASIYHETLREILEKMNKLAPVIPAAVKLKPRCFIPASWSHGEYLSRLPVADASPAIPPATAKALPSRALSSPTSASVGLFVSGRPVPDKTFITD